MSFPLAKKIANSEEFQTFILAIILLNAVVMGLETYPELNEFYDSWFFVIFYVSQPIFAFEIAVRVIAYAPSINKFFDDFWNVFDFTIVAASFIPAIGPFAIVARLARVLRVARVASVSDQLRVFLHNMRLSLGILLRAFLVAVVTFYIFAITGFYLFSETAPQHWGGLGRAFGSLFYLSLLQRVPDIVEASQPATRGAWAFFLIFYLLMLMFLINVIAAVVALHSKQRQETQADEKEHVH